MAGLSLLPAASGWFLALILFRAGWHKLAEPDRLGGIAMGYGAIPENWVGPVLRLLAVVELAVAAGLLAGPTRPLAALAAAGLFTGYLGLMARALAEGRREIDCGCGGAPQPVSRHTLMRNAVLIGFAALAALPVALEAAGPGGTLVPAAAGLTFLAAYAQTETLAAHLPYIRRVRADLAERTA